MSSRLDVSRRQLSLAALGLVLGGGAMTGPARAQSASGRPLRIIVPFAPGGASDTIARLLSEYLPARLGHSVVIDNKPGASTIIGVDAAVKSPGDGHTVLLAGVGSYSVLPALRKKLPFDIDRDLAFVALVAYTPNILVTAASKPFQTLPDLVKAAKAAPNAVRYAHYGDGSANHLAGVMLSRACKVELEGIPFKGAADAKLALLRGDVDLSFETLASAGGEIKAGRLRALAHGGAGRTRLLPQLPGLAEMGYGDAALQPFFGLTVPASTPEPVRARLAKEVMDVMALPEVRDKAAAAFLEPVSVSGAEMQAIVQRHTAVFRQLGQQLNLNLD